MIYQRLNSFPIIKKTYIYINITSAIIQTFAVFCLYPCVYPIFDGVKIFTSLFILSSFIMVPVYLIQCIASCFCNPQKQIIYALTSIIAFVSSILLVVGGIIYSPLIGHHEVREILFIIGETGFLISELAKFWKYHTKVLVSSIKDKDLAMSIFGSLSWLSQLLGTFCFVKNIYYTQIVILGVFLYGLSSILWAVKIWILTENGVSRQFIQRKNKQPQTRRLYDTQP